MTYPKQAVVKVPKETYPEGRLVSSGPVNREP